MALTPQLSPLARQLGIAARPVACRPQGWAIDDIHYYVDDRPLGIPAEVTPRWMMDRSDIEIADAADDLDRGVVLAAVDWVKLLIERVGTNAPRVLYNGATVALVDAQVTDDRLVLEVRPTCFLNSLLTNRSFSPLATRPGGYLQHAPVSGLANQLGINLTLLTADHHVIAANRSAKLHDLPGRTWSAVGGVVDGGLLDEDVPLLHRTAVDEIDLAVGLAVAEQSISFDGLVLDEDTLNLVAVGSVRLPYTAAHVLARVAPDARTEVSGRRAISIEKSALPTLMAELAAGSWEPVSALSLLIALGHVFEPAVLAAAAQKGIEAQPPKQA